VGKADRRRQVRFDVGAYWIVVIKVKVQAGRPLMMIESCRYVITKCTFCIKAMGWAGLVARMGRRKIHAPFSGGKKQKPE
jgi:hypothetical protein